MASAGAYGQYGSQSMHGSAYGSAPPAYAFNMTAGGAEKAQFLQGKRRRMNVVPILLSLFVPWVTFSIVFTVLSIWVHAEQPSLTYFIVGCCLVAVLATGGVAFGSRDPASSRRDPTWLNFLFAIMLLAWVAGVLLGKLNFSLVEAPHHEVKNLNEYSNVDPAVMRGEQVMDAGIVRFTGDSGLDLTKSMGFKNRDVYCVAPITRGDAALTSYDFWAVGINCCAGGRFTCEGANSQHATTGVRLMGESQRAFYRLAVQQAEGAYHIKASHPLFFHWVEEEAVDLTHLERSTTRNVAIGILSYFLFQFIVVAGATLVFSASH